MAVIPGSFCMDLSFLRQTPGETTSLFLTCETEGQGPFLNITNTYFKHSTWMWLHINWCNSKLDHWCCIKNFTPNPPITAKLCASTCLQLCSLELGLALGSGLALTPGCDMVRCRSNDVMTQLQHTRPMSSSKEDVGETKGRVTFKNTTWIVCEPSRITQCLWGPRLCRSDRQHV